MQIKVDFSPSADLVRVYIPFKALTSVGYGIIVDPVAWGLVDFIQKDGKFKQYLLFYNINE